MDRAQTQPEPARVAAPQGPSAEPAEFRAVYDEHVDFVWRCVQRFGVPASQLDDAVQDVFMAVYRGLRSFGARSTLRTWLYAVARNVALNHLRTARRQGLAGPLDEPAHAVVDQSPGPFELAAQSETLRAFESVLARIGEDRREVFLLTELEQMTAPEIAEALRIPLNTVYSRLRVARAEFERALAHRKVGTL